jgi:metal-responsive CopG/Arc/MetJ family transcriptional regulator
MKVKTSITLSEDVLQAIDAMCNGGGSRSEFIDNVLRAYIAYRKREERDARDIEIINRNADRLNREAEDVLEYQADL